jgi:hypothetical protein
VNPDIIHGRDPRTAEFPGYRIATHLGEVARIMQVRQIAPTEVRHAVVPIPADDLRMRVEDHGIHDIGPMPDTLGDHRWTRHTLEQRLS